MLIAECYVVHAALFLGRGGALAPERRALDNPMAIAWRRFLCSPFFRWRISVATAFCVFGPYLRCEPRCDGAEARVRDDRLDRAAEEWDRP
jgi:hypothetical protein